MKNNDKLVIEKLNKEIEIKTLKDNQRTEYLFNFFWSILMVLALGIGSFFISAQIDDLKSDMDEQTKLLVWFIELYTFDLIYAIGIVMIIIVFIRDTNEYTKKRKEYNKLLEENNNASKSQV